MDRKTTRQQLQIMGASYHNTVTALDCAEADRYKWKEVIPTVFTRYNGPDDWDVMDYDSNWTGTDKPTGHT